MINCTVSSDVIFASINSVIPNTLPYREATKEIRYNNVLRTVAEVVWPVGVVAQSRKQQLVTVRCEGANGGE